MRDVGDVGDACVVCSGLVAWFWKGAYWGLEYEKRHTRENLISHDGRRACVFFSFRAPPERLRRHTAGKAEKWTYPQWKVRELERLPPGP